MKLERNRAERRNKKGVQIFFCSVPYLIFAALAAGFLAGVPQAAAISAIEQAGKATVTVVKHKRFPFIAAGYIGKTNSVISRGFTEEDFTYTGSKAWIDDGNGNFRLKFLTSGTFTPTKQVKIDVFIVGGGSGGNAGGAGSATNAGGGGAGGLTGTWTNITLNANQAYSIVVGGGGAGGQTYGSAGGTSSAFGYSKAGGSSRTTGAYWGNNGGSGGGGATGGGATGGSDGSNGNGAQAGTGQGTTTREFGEAGAALYAGGGGSGGGVGGAGGGANGGAMGSAGYGASAAANYGGGGGGGGGKSGSSNLTNGGSGGSGIVVIRNMR